MKSWEFMNLGKFTNFNISFFPFDTTLVRVWNLCHYRKKARVAICCWLANLSTCWNNSLKVVFCSTIQYNCQPTCWNNSLNMVYLLYSTFKAYLLKQLFKNCVLVVLQTCKAHLLKQFPQHGVLVVFKTFKAHLLKQFPKQWLLVKIQVIGVQ